MGVKPKNHALLYFNQCGDKPINTDRALKKSLWSFEEFVRVCVFFHMVTLLNRISLPSNAPTGAMWKLAAWARGSTASCFLSVLMTTQATRRNEREYKKDTTVVKKWVFFTFLIGFNCNMDQMTFYSKTYRNRHLGHVGLQDLFFFVLLINCQSYMNLIIS